MENLYKRISDSQKRANNNQWYKDWADRLDKAQHNNLHTSQSSDPNLPSDFHRMKTNYDLFNNILNLKDFEYVCKPFGDGVGELPARMVNRDIISGKIKAILGLEMKRPFNWKVFATNPEATSRKEQEEFSKIKEFVISEIMLPIRQELEQKYQAEMQGKELSEDEKQKINEKIAEETKAMTPDEVKKYMVREHQDPAELMYHQILEYLTIEQDLKTKFDNAKKHLHLSAKEIMYVGIFNDEPVAWNVNSLYFGCDMVSDDPCIENREWATYPLYMTPSQIVSLFKDLTNKEIDEIYSKYNPAHTYGKDEDIFDTLDGQEYNKGENIRVLHCTWKALREISFLSYIDQETGEPGKMIVNESYKLNEKAGDIAIKKDWYPETYECWKIGEDIYTYARPIPGQHKDIDNLHVSNLPYYGVICDNTNSQPTCITDRLKIYQYLLNIVFYRIELLIGSDKGKKILTNIKSIPNKEGMDIEKVQYFLESSPFFWVDPSEEGSGYNDINMSAKVLDLSLASDIGKYIDFTEHIMQQASRASGVSPEMEAQIGQYDAVSNTRQALMNSSQILEPYFQLHNLFKKNVLNALLNTAKVAYRNSDKKKLQYILDDLSIKTLQLDIGLLDSTTINLFVGNSSKASEALETIKQLSHAAMQNQKVELSDVISVIESESVTEAGEILRAAENERREQEQIGQKQQLEREKEREEKQRQHEELQHQRELELMDKELQGKKELEIIKGSLMGASFNPDQDKDNDGVNDFVEMAREQYTKELDQRKQALDESKFSHQKNIDKEKLKLENKKLNKK